MTMIIDPYKFSKPLALAFINSGSDSADSSSYNFGNFTATEAGLMIVGVAARHGATGPTEVQDVQIGGSAATLHVNPSSTGRMISAIGSRVVAAGAQNVTVNFSTGANRCAVGVWLLTNYSSITPFDTDGFNVATVNTTALTTLDIPAGGIAIFAHCHDNDNATSWSSATGRADISLELFKQAFADKATAALITNHAETASWTGSVKRGISSASWV